MKNASLFLAIGALIVGTIGGYLIGNEPRRSRMEPEHQAVVSPSTPNTNVNTNTSEAGTDEWKIQNAMSAAPDNISKEATVVDWPAKEGAEFRKLRAGTNKLTCIPDYPASPGNDPFCGDELSMQWFGAYMSKKIPTIAQAGIGYMLQGGSDPSNTDPFATEPKAGESWMSAPPHIMVFPTTPSDPKVYGTDPDSGKPWVMWANTPYAHLMVPVQK